jgi:hypothetical protein
MALLRLVDNSAVENEKIKLTKEQKLMLEMSEADIQNGRTIVILPSCWTQSWQG